MGAGPGADPRRIGWFNGSRPLLRPTHPDPGAPGYFARQLKADGSKADVDQMGQNYNTQTGRYGRLAVKCGEVECTQHLVIDPSEELGSLDGWTFNQTAGFRCPVHSPKPGT